MRGGVARGPRRGRRCCARTAGTGHTTGVRSTAARRGTGARGRHSGVAVKIGAFVDDQRACAYLARNPASRSDLYAAFAVDLAIYLAGDCHLGAGQSRGHMRTLFDDDRAGALDLTLHRAVQANGALTLQRAFEMGALANQALYFGSIRMHATRHSPCGLADVHVARNWTKTRAPGAGGGAARWS